MTDFNPRNTLVPSNVFSDTMVFYHTCSSKQDHAPLGTRNYSGREGRKKSKHPPVKRGRPRLPLDFYLTPVQVSLASQ